MEFLELLLLAVALSMDAFAVAICIGLTMKRVSFKKAFIVGLYFGIFQAGMPLIGYFTTNIFADRIAAYSHWIAFGLLSILGGKMIADSFKKEEGSDKNRPDRTCGDQTCFSDEKSNNKEHSLKLAAMLPLAIATSVDALAVGITFSFLQVNILPAVLLIGIVTLVISITGVKIGNMFGVRFKSKAQLAGGIILVFIGLRILLEHLNIISFSF